MPAKDAVYFTAHYDKTGKLMEVTSPQPIKFMGKEDNAIGYIERNGEVYTLPVTKKAYNKMMTEVAKKQGMGINLSPQEQISSGTEVSAQVKPKAEVVSQVPLVEAMSKVQISVSISKEDAIKEIDKILKNRKPEEVAKMLKHEVASGRDRIVDLVEPGRRKQVTDDLIGPWVEHMVANMVTALPIFDVVPPDLNAELDHEETVAHIEQAVREAGHEVVRVGNARHLPQVFLHRPVFDAAQLARVVAITFEAD